MSILTRVQANPEIGTKNAAYVAELVTRAKDFITKFCNYPSFPELSQGYAKSATGASTDISSIASNTLYVSVNGTSYHTITLDLAACNTGDNIAAELQTKIRAANTNYGYDEVTVEWDSTATQYTITSGRYGLTSRINFSFSEGSKHVCQNLKLTPTYGGTEVYGNVDSDSLQDACVMLVEMKYRQLGLEGLGSASLPGGISFSSHDLDPNLKSLLLANRRLF